MKNSFKTGLLALIIIASVSSCYFGDKAPATVKKDSGKTVIDTTSKAAIDTAKKDTSKRQ